MAADKNGPQAGPFGGASDKSHHNAFDDAIPLGIVERRFRGTKGDEPKASRHGNTRQPGGQGFIHVNPA
jgi:hypothetical protein